MLWHLEVWLITVHVFSLSCFGGVVVFVACQSFCELCPACALATSAEVLSFHNCMVRYTCNYIPHHLLLTGWQWMAFGGEQPSPKQAIGELDTSWLWCLLTELGEGTHQEHIHKDTWSSQWVIVVPYHYAHSVRTSVNDVAMNSFPTTLSLHLHL